MDLIKKKYYDLKSSGIDLGAEIAERNQMPGEYKHAEAVLPCQFQCYTKGVILFSTQECIWMNYHFLEKYASLLRKGFPIGLPVRDQIEKTEIRNDKKRLYRYLFCSNCLIYSINHKLHAVCNEYSRFKKYIEEQYLPESSIRSISWLPMGFLYYRSGEYVIASTSEMIPVRPPFNPVYRNKNYIFPVEEFDYAISVLANVKFNTGKVKEFKSEVIEFIYDNYYESNTNPVPVRDYLLSEYVKIDTLSVPPYNESSFWYNMRYGFATDKNYWYVLQNHTEKHIPGGKEEPGTWVPDKKGGFWQIPMTSSLTNPSEKARKWVEYDYQLGDCDCYNGYLFIPAYNTYEDMKAESNISNSHIAIFNTRTLKLEAVVFPADRDGTVLDRLKWVAINPKNGKLYTGVGDFFGKTPIYVYDIDFSRIGSSDQILTLAGEIWLQDKNGKSISFRAPSGAAFDEDGHLYYVNHYLEPGFDDEAAGIWIFKIPTDIELSRPVYVKGIERSGDKYGFDFPTESAYHYSRGAAFWSIGKNLNHKAYTGYLLVCMEITGGSDFPDVKWEQEILLYCYKIQWKKYIDICRFIQ
ncbi:MAG: hypothetical protein Q4B85_14005 [Lachnospiraceae bacterium]|nr:hypothetical protein [Lachnospiraceae bacterium]